MVRPTTGLVDKLASEGQSALDCATELAREILPAGPLAIQAAKLAIDKGEAMDLYVTSPELSQKDQQISADP